MSNIVSRNALAGFAEPFCGRGREGKGKVEEERKRGEKTLPTRNKFLVTASVCVFELLLV